MKKKKKLYFTYSLSNTDVYGDPLGNAAPA